MVCRRYQQPVNGRNKKEAATTESALSDVAARLGCTPQDIKDYTFEYMPASTVVWKVLGSAKPGMYYVATGSLTEEFPNTDNAASTALGNASSSITVGRGNFVGIYEVLGDMPPQSTLVVQSDAQLLWIPAAQITSLCKDFQVFSSVAQIGLKGLSPLIRQLDFGIKSAHYEAGRSLFHQNDPAHTIYLVLSGRFRSVASNKEGTGRLLKQEFGKDDVIGDLESFTESERADSVHAVRDSDVAEVPASMIHHLHYRYPHALIHFVRSIGTRVFAAAKARRNGGDGLGINENFTSIALIAASQSSYIVYNIANPVFQNSAKSGFEMCFGPSTLGAGA